MEVTIRKAQATDFPAVFALIKEFSIFQQAGDNVAITLEQMIKEQHLFQLLCSRNK